MAEQILLSISILASRKKEQVKRCLDSLKLITEHIPSELILVDTSGDAAVHEMLQLYSDHVVEFAWCNDFAKARNVGLKEAKGEWFLYVDDDEWFEDVGELLDFFQSGEYRKYGCANYIQRNYHDLKLVNYSDAWASRMIRIGKDTHFRSKIHEYLYPQEGECKNLHVIVGHTGYIYLTDEDRAKHFDRNYPLLLEMMKEEPQRLRWRVQIVQEFHAVKRWEELLVFCEESLDFSRNLDDEWDNRDIGTFYAGAAESALNLGQYEKVRQAGGRMKADRRMSELCHAYLAVLQAQAAYRQRRWEEAEKYLQEYSEKMEFLRTHRLKQEIQEGAILVASASDSMIIKRAVSLAMGCALMQGDTSVLREHFDRLEWEKPVIYVADDFFPTLIEGMATLPQEPVFVRAMQCLWNNSEMEKKMFVAIQSWEEKSTEGFYRLLRIAAQVEGSHWYLWYARILVAGQTGEAANLRDDFRGFCRSTPDVFLTPPNITEILHRYDISVEEGYLSVPFDRWETQLKEYAAKVPLQDLLLTERELGEMQTRESVHFLYALMRISEEKVFRCREVKSYDRKRAFFLEFADRAAAFCRRYYQDEIIRNMPELLPENLQAALYLEQAFLVEEKEPVRAAECERLAASVYPRMAERIRSFMQETGRERIRKEREARAEMHRLERQVKERVIKCIEKEQFADALIILEQLKQMRPNDLELVTLTLRARIGMLEAELELEQQGQDASESAAQRE